MQTFKGTGLLLATELSLSIKTNRYSVVLGIHLDNELFKVKDSFTHALPPLLPAPSTIPGPKPPA